MILALKTDGPNAEIYLLDDEGKQTDIKKWVAGFELSKQLLVEIQKLLKKHKKEFKDVSGVILYKGPGSFTALRIGVSVGNALAYANKVPVVGVDGTNWIEEGFKMLPSAKQGAFVVPEYGALPHITRQKK